MYEATMSLYRKLLKSGLITEDDLTLLAEKLNEKYSPLFATLRAKNA